MKKIINRTLTFAILVLLSTVFSFGQIAQLKVSLSISSHPDPYLSNWPNIKNTVIVSVINSGSKSIDAKFDCKVSLDAVLKANTKPESMRILQLPPGVSQFYGEDLVPFEAMKIAGGADKTAIRTGMLPAGFYEFCVSLIDPNTGSSLTQPVCKNFTMTSFQAPVLLQPQDGSTLAKLNRPTFRWTPVSPKYPSVVSYRVCVFEVLAGQTPVNAFRVNMPIFDATTTGTSLILPPDVDLPVFWAPANTNAGISIDEKGKGNQYVWSVQAQDDAGNPIIQDPTSWAEPFTFWGDGDADMSIKDSYITLQQPANGAEIDLSKKQTFKWTALPKAVNYSLKMVEIIGDQTPEMALKQNKPFYENLSIPTNSIDIDSSSLRFRLVSSSQGGIAWQVSSDNEKSEPFTFNGFWGDGDADKVVNKLNDSVSLSSNLMRIILISPTTENPSQSLTPDFIWEIRTPNRKIGIMTYEIKLGVMTNDIDTNRSNGNVVVVWPINSEVIFEQKGIKENQLNFPSDLPPLDSTKAYCWQVTAIDQNGEKIGTSTVSATQAWPPPVGGVGSIYNPCSCQLSSLAFPPPPPYNYMVCVNQQLQQYSANLFQGNCTLGTSNFSWSTSNTPSSVWTSTMAPTSTTPSIQTYYFKQEIVSPSGTVLKKCTKQIKIKVIDPVQPLIGICGDANNSYKQCCGVQSFKLRDLTIASNAICTAIPANFFPAGTTYKWFIASTSLPSGNYGGAFAAPSLATTYNFFSSCWNPSSTSTPIPGTWYSFGNNIIQNAPGNSSVSSLSAGSYFIICHMDFPMNTCMPSGYTTNPFPFTIETNSNMISADVNPIQPNCGSNGQIVVNSISGGSGPYSLKLNSSPFVSPSATSYPYFFSGLADNNNSPGYTLIIKDLLSCSPNSFTTVVYTGAFGWNGPQVPLIVSPNIHSIPICNGSINLTASFNPPNLGTFNYQWIYCSGCTACNTTTSCYATNCPSPSSTTSTYVNLGSSSSSNTSPPIYLPGCYRVKITDANGGCNVSAGWYVTTPFPKPVIEGLKFICLNGQSIVLTTTTIAGGSLLWSTGATTSSITISTPGTYTVSSIVGTCTTASDQFEVIAVPCNCDFCNFSISPSIQVVGNGSGNFNLMLNINNTSNCPANMTIAMVGGTLGLSGGTSPVPIGSSSSNFQFSSNMVYPDEVSVELAFTLSTGFTNASTCKKRFKVQIPQ